MRLEVPLGDVCWCLISAGDWLFCGLGDGTIKAEAREAVAVWSVSGCFHFVVAICSHQILFFGAGLHEVGSADSSDRPQEAGVLLLGRQRHGEESWGVRSKGFGGSIF